MRHIITTERDGEYQRREELLRNSERRYRRLFEAAQDGILILDADSGTVLDVNPFLLNLLGYAREQIANRKFWKTGAFGELASGPAAFEALRGHAQIREDVTLHTKDGRQIPVQFSSNVFEAGAERVMQCHIQDLSEHKRMQAALRENVEQSNLILNSALDAVITMDGAGLITGWNTQAEKVFGWTRQESIGRRLASLIIPERYRISHENGMTRYRATGESQILNSRVELSGLHRDGHEFPVELAVSTGKNGEAVSFSAFLRDISERKLSEAELERRAEEFKVLADTAHDLGGEQAVATLLQTIIERARKLLGVNSGSIYLYDAERGDLESAFLQGLAPNVGSRLPLGEGAAGRAALSRKPLLIDDYETWEGKSARYSTIPVQSILCVPMLYSGELIGVLSAIELVGSTRRFTESDVQLLSVFAGQVASAVHNARTLEQARRRADQLQALNEVSQYITGALELGPLLRQVVTRVRTVLGLYYVTIAMVEGDELVFLDGDSRQPLLFDTQPHERVKVSDASISGWVALNGVTFLAPDVSAELRYRLMAALPDVKSELIVPLRIQNKVIGVLDAASDRLNAFSTEHVNLVVALAAQVAVAIQNSQLFAETRGRLAELEAVSRVNAALRSLPTVDAILPVLLQVTLEVLHAQQGSIWLYHAAEDELRPAVMQGYGPAYGDPPLPPIKPGMGVAGIVYASGEAIVSREFCTDPRVPESSQRLTPAGVGGAGVPIRAADSVLGTFIVRVPLPRDVTPAEVRLLTTLSEIAGNAIQRTTLRQQTERRLRFLTALSEIDRVISSSFDLHLSLSVLLGHVTAQLDVDAADVLLFNTGSQMLEFAAARGFRGKAIERTRIRIGEGLAGRAVLERRLIHFINTEENRKAAGASGPLGHVMTGEGFISYFCVPLMAKGKVKGVLEAYQREPSEPDEEWLDFLRSLGERAAIAIDNVTLFDGLQRSNNELVLAYDATIEGWSRALELRDKETEGHTQRAADITASLAREFGLSEDELVQVRWGALLHDIGKMGIPDGILLKAGPLNDAEWLVMKTHPALAYEMLSPIRYLRSALDIPFSHHEKWDGSGYPRGLKGEQIPLSARIFAVVDVWDALRSDRPYRKGWSEEDVLAHVQAGSGSHFDPAVVELFLGMRRRLKAERETEEQ